MTQAYSDPRRENDPHALPDVEIFTSEIWLVSCDRCCRADDEALAGQCVECGHTAHAKLTGRTGWFFWFCFPGCMPESSAYGPYKSSAEALKAAREICSDSDCDDAPCQEWRRSPCRCGLQNACHYGLSETIQNECTTCGWAQEDHKESKEG